MQGAVPVKGQKWKRVQPNNILKSYGKDISENIKKSIELA